MRSRVKSREVLLSTALTVSTVRFCTAETVQEPPPGAVRASDVIVGELMFVEVIATGSTAP
jgi:hypothetical protein